MRSQATMNYELKAKGVYDAMFVLIDSHCYNNDN